MLESEELLDVLLGIAKLNIAQTGFLQMTESWDSRTENIGRSNDRGYGVGNRSNSFSNSASSEWVSGIASDPDRYSWQCRGNFSVAKSWDCFDSAGFSCSVCCRKTLARAGRGREIF